MRSLLLCALVAAAPSAHAAPDASHAPTPDAPDARPLLRVCTGRPGNNYHRVGLALAERLAPKVRVEVVETEGSWENLEAIDAEHRRCDAIIAQDDAYALYEFEHPESRLTMERTAVLYAEYVHVLCNTKVTARSVSELDPGRHQILVNRYGSGTYITWKLFQRLDPAYQRVRSAEVDMDEGLLKIADGTRAHCMIYVSGKGGKTLRTADERFGDRLRLIGVEDGHLHREVGRDKRVVYRRARLEADTYPHLQTGPIDTQQVDAVFFASPEWKARRPAAAAALAEALVQLIPDLQKTLQ